MFMPICMSNTFSLCFLIHLVYVLSNTFSLCLCLYVYLIHLVSECLHNSLLAFDTSIYIDVDRYLVHLVTDYRYVSTTFSLRVPAQQLAGIMWHKWARGAVPIRTELHFVYVTQCVCCTIYIVYATLHILCMLHIVYICYTLCIYIHYVHCVCYTLCIYCVFSTLQV